MMPETFLCIELYKLNFDGSLSGHIWDKRKN